MLDKNITMCYNEYTSNGVYFFVRFFKRDKPQMPPQRAAVYEGGNMKTGGAESESKNYIGVFGVQAAQLQLYEEQEERPRQT